MTLNTWLLSNFAPHTGRCADIEVLLTVYQSLSIIYVNLLMLFWMLLWKLIDWTIYPLPGDVVIYSTTPLIITSLILLKNGKKDMAAFTCLGFLHVGNFLSSAVSSISLGAAYFVAFFPAIAFFLSSSPKVHAFNMILCFLQNIGHTIRIREVFRVTFTDEQTAEIVGIQFLSFTFIGLTWLLFYIQKSIEKKLWDVAQSNFEKAENITKEVVQAIKAKDTFVSSLSHEIRNPLNSVNGSINYLLKTVKEPSYLKVLSAAKFSGEILLNLVNNVLDAAKLTSEKMDLCYVETDLPDITRKAIAINSENLKSSEISAQTFIAKNLFPLLWIDPSRLLQIIMNLLSNAIKFTPKGGKIRLCLTWLEENCNKNVLLEPIQELLFQEAHLNNRSTVESETPKFTHIDTSKSTMSEAEIQEFDINETKWSTSTKYLQGPKKKSLTQIKFKYAELTENFDVWSMYKVSASLESQSNELFHSLGLKMNNSLHKKGFLKIQVSDTGKGIAPHNISKVFEMFSQVDQQASSVHGSGLGLWICKQICRKMGGDITIYSELNKGTTVVLYIPINNEPLSQAVGSRVLWKEKVRALVVDDYAYNRDVHKLILEKEGVEVVLACDGKEALDAYISKEEDYFDFIMMDIQMPVMDGFTAAKKIREWERMNNKNKTDIYFVSGEYYSEDQLISELESKVQISKGGIRCLRKPIDVGMIKQIIGQYVRQQKAN